MKVCQSVSSISRSGAGVSGFLLPLSQNLLKSNVDIGILSLEDEYSALDSGLWQPMQLIVLKNYIKSFCFSVGFIKALNSIDPSLIHQHGVWTYPSFPVLKWSQSHRVPRIISPHGMLEPWAWKHKNWKKKPIWNLWEKHNFETAAAIHVTSEQEMNSVRMMGVNTPVAIIPIGVEIPSFIKKDNCNIKKTIVFMSRIHPKKGLENLILAWNQIKHSDWQVIIAGPGEESYIAELVSLVHKLGLENQVLFKDAVYGDEKWELIANADLFVLPSFSENFGIVIAEALCCEVPVITTTATPWQGLIDRNCGWWIELGIEPLVDALREAIALSTEQRKLMGRRGREYMEQSFSWHECAQKMKDLYDWVLNKNDKPDFVYFKE